MQINERLLIRGQIVESDRNKLPPGVLCRVKYPICNIGKLNANNRIYEKSVWEQVLASSDLQSKLKSRALFGHAEHPQTSQSDLQLTSHVVVDMSIDESGSTVYQLLDVVDTPTGRIVDTLLRAQCQVGVSTRAEGDIEEKEDDKGQKYQRVIPERYKYITTDFTADPSTFGAIPIDIKRGAVSAIKAESTNEKATADEKKFAAALIESMKCSDKTKCQKCGCCPKGEDKKSVDESQVSVEVTPNAGSVALSGQVTDVQIAPNPENQRVQINVVTVDPQVQITPEPAKACDEPGKCPFPVEPAPVGEVEGEFDKPYEPGYEGEPTEESKANKESNISDEVKKYAEQDIKDINTLLTYSVSTDATVGKTIIKEENDGYTVEFEVKDEDGNVEGIIKNHYHKRPHKLIDVYIKQAGGDEWVRVTKSREGKGGILLTALSDLSGVYEFEDEVDEDKLEETKSIDDIYKKAGFAPPKGKGIHTKAFHELAVNVAKGYKKKGESEDESLKKGYATAMDQLGKEKAVKKAHRRSESKMNAFKVLLNGKEIDIVFDEETDPEEVKRSLINHDGYDPNIKVIKEGIHPRYSKASDRERKLFGELKRDHPNWSSDSVWGLVDQVIKAEQVIDANLAAGKDSHVKVSAESKVNEATTGLVSLYISQTLAGEWGIYRVSDSGQSLLIFSFDNKDEALNKGKAIAELVGVPLSMEKPKDLASKIESVTTFVKEMVDLKVKEATTRSEKEALSEAVNSLSNKELQSKIIISKLKDAKSQNESEVQALSSKLEEKVKLLADVNKQLVEAKKFTDKAHADYREALTKLESEHKKQLEQVKADCESKICESVKALIKEYISSQMGNLQVHDNVRALLEGCKSLADVDRVIDEYRDIRRRNALRSKSTEPVVEKKNESVNKPVGRFEQVGRMVCESLLGKVDN